MRDLQKYLDLLRQSLVPEDVDIVDLAEEALFRAVKAESDFALVEKTMFYFRERAIETKALNKELLDALQDAQKALLGEAKLKQATSDALTSVNLALAHHKEDQHGSR